MSKKTAIKGWTEIQSDFERMCDMKCVPHDLQKVRADYVFDEDKSVKWNKEQVELNNFRYQEEVARLNREKNKCRDKIHEDIYKAIQSDVGHNLSRKKAMAIWNFAYEEGHAYGFPSIMSELQELMELADTLLGGDE